MAEYNTAYTNRAYDVSANGDAQPYYLRFHSRREEAEFLLKFPVKTTTFYFRRDYKELISSKDKLVAF